MNDLSESLRKEGGFPEQVEAFNEAADEIERLTIVLADAEQRVKDVEFVRDHNVAQIKMFAKENKALRDEIERLSTGWKRMGKDLANYRDKIVELRAENKKLQAAVVAAKVMVKTHKPKDFAPAEIIMADAALRAALQEIDE